MSETAFLTSSRLYLPLALNFVAIVGLAGLNYESLTAGMPYYFGQWMVALLFGWVISLFQPQKSRRGVITLWAALPILLLFNIRESLDAFESREAKSALTNVAGPAALDNVLATKSHNRIIRTMGFVRASAEESMNEIAALSDKLSPPEMLSPIRYDVADEQTLRKQLNVMNQISALAAGMPAQVEFVFKAERSKIALQLDKEGFSSDFKTATLVEVDARISDYSKAINKVVDLKRVYVDQFASVISIYISEQGKYHTNPEGNLIFTNAAVVDGFNETLAAVAKTEAAMAAAVEEMAELDKRYTAKFQELTTAR